GPRQSGHEDHPRAVGKASEALVQRGVALHDAHVIVSPPETESVWPVMKPASSEARNTTAGAMSSGTPRRPHGMTRFKLSASFGLAAANSLRKSGVSDGPGQTQLTLMRWRATSRATA